MTSALNELMFQTPGVGFPYRTAPTEPLPQPLELIPPTAQNLCDPIVVHVLAQVFWEYEEVVHSVFFHTPDWQDHQKTTTVYEAGSYGTFT